MGRTARDIRLGQWKDTRTFTTVHFLYILCKEPAHIVQRPTGKTPGAPDGQSACQRHSHFSHHSPQHLRSQDHNHLSFNSPHLSPTIKTPVKSMFRPVTHCPVYGSYSWTKPDPFATYLCVSPPWSFQWPPPFLLFHVIQAYWPKDCYRHPSNPDPLRLYSIHPLSPSDSLPCVTSINTLVWPIPSVSPNLCHDTATVCNPIYIVYMCIPNKSSKHPSHHIQNCRSYY